MSQQDMKEPRGRAATGAQSKDQVKAGSAATLPQRDDIAQQLRRRREAAMRLPPMPCGHRDPLECQAEVHREQARWHITLGSVRAHLEEQPSLSARRAAARRWCAAITAMAEEVAP